MEKMIRESVSLLKHANHIYELIKGFSNDKKYVIDNKYLLRIFPINEETKRKIEYETINKLAAFSNYVPKVIEFNRMNHGDFSYMLLTYLPGDDGETALKALTEQEQLSAGFQAGAELLKLHNLQAPQNYPSWYSVKKRKNDKYLLEFNNLPISSRLKELLTTYITENEHIMMERPNTFQHDDFHPSNLLIHQKKFSGIIDFQRMDWGDPIHDLQKLGFFSKGVSIPFTKGIIDGYNEGQPIKQSFWKLYTFYSAVHIVSAMVWSLRISKEQYELILEYSLDVIKDHEEFNRIIPIWYEKLL
ncbi:aminoglycoside phosphotransferase family protein [Metabacillus niabensis]|uniref:Aminoglycoside phosphotransferase (APT) family kinase protein n=1 Tax=Metabacillus niabensis TaxID=324854 RepID=A0ABT9Z138_9BACI|nr:aminoglycoside phosphotransferase family protein [Metabacillus niabensis]MDQ0225974.1 aminoglycoside phosphotransferase (APT) family kinase protein [Metabacillus niabensis]